MVPHPLNDRRCPNILMSDLTLEFADCCNRLRKCRLGRFTQVCDEFAVGSASSPPLATQFFDQCLRHVERDLIALVVVDDLGALQQAEIDEFAHAA